MNFRDPYVVSETVAQAKVSGVFLVKSCDELA